MPQGVSFISNLTLYALSVSGAGKSLQYSGSHHRKGQSTQNTHPTYGFRPEPATEQEKQAHRHAAGKGGKKELPHRQPEKHGFRVNDDSSSFTPFTSNSFLRYIYCLQLQYSI